jgi:hypothetical protein
MSSGDRWHLRDGGELKGLTVTVRRFGVEPGAEPKPSDEIELWSADDSRWLTVEALRANAHARVKSRALVSAEDIPGGVRTRQHLVSMGGYPATDIVQEETLS